MDFAERLKSAGRNDACPCGSGKKYKKCHLAEDQAAEAAMFKKQQEEAAKAMAEAAEKEDAGDDKQQAAATGRQHLKQLSNNSIPSQRRKDNKPNIPRRSAV